MHACRRHAVSLCHTPLTPTQNQQLSLYQSLPLSTPVLQCSHFKEKSEPAYAYVCERVLTVCCKSGIPMRMTAAFPWRSSIGSEVDLVPGEARMLSSPWLPLVGACCCRGRSRASCLPSAGGLIGMLRESVCVCECVCVLLNTPASQPYNTTYTCIFSQTHSNALLYVDFARSDIRCIVVGSCFIIRTPKHLWLIMSKCDR